MTQMPPLSAMVAIMKEKILKTILVTFAVFLPGTIHAEDAKTLLQQGLFAEEAEQKLDKAAANYEQIIESYDSRREYAIAALYRLAEVRRKQKRNDDAAILYKRIVTDFPDADPQARLSRENLKAMGISVSETVSEIPNDPDEDKELRRLMILAENSPQRIWEKVPPQLPPNMSSHDISPLANAAWQGWVRVATWLLDHPDPANEHSFTEDLPLYRAAESGHLDLCKLLVSRGLTIEDAHSALVSAIENNFDPVAQWLVEMGADINDSNTAYLEANDGQKVYALLTPLSVAIAKDNGPWIDRLLELKADVKGVPKRDGSQTISPIAVACWKGHAPLVRRLLEAGADPNMGDSIHDFSVAPMRLLKTCGKGWTPLHYAATNLEILGDLLKAGADPKVADTTGITPLHVAAHAGNPECVRLLVEAGADPNLEGSMSETPNSEVRLVTPLSLAAGRNDVAIAQEIIAAFIANGADPFHEIEKGLAVTVGDIPANAIFVSEEYLFPKLAEKRALSVAFSEAGMSFELATPTGDEAPPDFATTLLSWKNAVEIRRPEDSEFNWENPTLWRRSADGNFAKTPVAIMDEGGYPEMQWGDIIVFAIGHIDRSTVPSIRTGSRPAPRYDTTIPSDIYYALRGSAPFPLKVTAENVPARDFTVNGGIAVRTPPWTTVTDSPFAIFDPVFNVEGAVTKSVTVRRGDQIFDLERTFSPYFSPDFVLQSGDEITEVKAVTQKLRRDHVEVVEPELPYQVYSNYKYPPASDEEQADFGTLFQAIATSYSQYALEAEDTSEQALRTLARSRFKGIGIITHPDFSSVRIRRLKPDDTEEVIDVPVAEFIAACGPDASPADCRAKDIDLQPGDIVELKPLPDRLGEPWTGFDQATAPFFEKALTYNIRIKPITGDEISGTVRWMAPTFHHTKAGPVGIISDETTLRTPTISGALSLLAPKLSIRGFPTSDPLRDGMIITEKPISSKQRDSSPRRRVVLPPSR